MYILNGPKTEIINSEYVERFCVVDKVDAALVVVSYSSERPPLTISRYKDVQEAKEALYQMMSALSSDWRVFEMPESLYYAEERRIKDARTKRKGGS